MNLIYKTIEDGSIWLLSHQSKCGNNALYSHCKLKFDFATIGRLSFLNKISYKIGKYRSENFFKKPVYIFSLQQQRFPDG